MAGSSSATRVATIAIVTSNSMSVNAAMLLVSLDVGMRLLRISTRNLNVKAPAKSRGIVVVRNVSCCPTLFEIKTEFISLAKDGDFFSRYARSVEPIAIYVGGSAVIFAFWL
jgi:hypothetical protein